MLFSLALSVLATRFVGSLPAADDAPLKPAELPAKAITVPFEVLKSGHLAVMVKINGKGPYRLIFDTGAPTNLLNTKIAKEADLLKGAAKPAFAPLGPMAEAKVKTMEVGDVVAEDVPAIVMDHPTISAISKALGPIDGIVGFPFFARYKTALDYQAKTLTFTPNGYKPPDVMKSMALALLSGDQPKVLAPAAHWGLVADKKDGDDEPGVDVKEVMPNSPAAKAGIKPGDRLLTLDARWTDSLADLYRAASFVKAGTTVPVILKRGRAEIEIRITPVPGL
jgi:membrane-associated protease RseP (regulator of RpoE activity)